MEKNKITTEMLVIMSLMIALQIVLSKILSINISILRIGFGFLPIAILAILYGPLWAGIAYAIGDLIGAFIFPTGPFFIGFTISSFLSGVILGVVLYKKEVTFMRAFIASAILCLAINQILNTFWLTFLTGKLFKVLFPMRLLKEMFAIPIMTILIVVMDRTVVKSINRQLIK